MLQYVFAGSLLLLQLILVSADNPSYSACAMDQQALDTSHDCVVPFIATSHCSTHMLDARKSSPEATNARQELAFSL